ncbi:MAG: sigma-54-dependent transcriptional regulator [Janthinobacterium lividum]
MTNILIVDDDAGLREGIAETVIDLGYVALTAGDGLAALELLGRQPVDAVLLDLRMPGLDGLEVLARIRTRANAPPVAILTAVATASNTIEAMRLGAVDHLTKPVGRAELADLIERMLRLHPAQAVGEPSRPPDREELVGASAPMRAIQKTIGLLADSDATVLISGETGTGKEVVAQALHRHGRRRGERFVAINCAAIPVDLMESELFGHVRGAIADRVGYFREAHRGTLFLDEVGDMALPMQSKLLRALQERIVVPVGGAAIPVDVRVVAASHRDLPEAVRAGAFREDLYYRLGVVPVVVPPLRERLADIVPLAEHFLARAAAASPLRLTAEAAALLLSHPWPGNVRELQNAMQRVTALVRGPVVEARDLVFLNPARTEPPEQDWLDGDLDTAIARIETAMIRRALAASGGNRAEAARRLGIHRQMLHTKMRRLGLDASAIGT